MPFDSMVKIHSLVQFSVDHFPKLVGPSLVLLLCLFVVFAYDMINRFFTFSAEPTLAILFRIIGFPLT